jgi:hypothetical protein
VSQVRKFLPENKLAKTITDPRGMLLGHAVQKASQNIENVRDVHMVALEGKLDELARVAATASHSQSADDAAMLYRLAREVLGDAGIFGLKHISRAAHSLCELMAAGDRHRHQWAGVAVHIEAIAILRRESAAPTGANIETMLAGLETISRAAI